MISGRVERQYSRCCSCSCWQLSSRCPSSKYAMPFAASYKVGCTKPKNFGFFRCFEPISKQRKQTELFRNKPKQPYIFWKIPKYALYQTASVGLLFVLVQLKQRKSLFWYWNRLFQNKPKQTETTRNFLNKYQNMLSIKLFRLLFCLFRFNRNTETLCFGIEPKQSKKMFCFG